MEIDEPKNKGLWGEFKNDDDNAPEEEKVCEPETSAEELTEKLQEVDDSENAPGNAPENPRENQDKGASEPEPEVNASETTENKSDQAKSEFADPATFKKPILFIGPRKNVVKVASQGTAAEVFSNSEQQTDSENKTPIPEQSEQKTPTLDPPIPLPYKEPAWSGLPDDVYKFEVLKSGVILETIDLSHKNFHVVGRLPVCDISMAHPTISRFHAIIQFRDKGDEKNARGLYVYDLGSTHGTFWNGNRIRPNTYARIQGGHMLRFGCSQRKFILQAPEEDVEEESELSLTELKELRRRELLEKKEEEERLKKLEEEEEKARKEKEENEGVDWGMAEDADEETDLTENPYAQSNNEELFLDDPKKTLRGWFEREGFDLQYQTEDKGIGKFLCWVDLPIDGRQVRAEALVTGKKKEAVIQCALEACRVLDRHGMLRQANHEGRKRKTKNWEDDDYYDSDEDNFLDRTGAIEKKRQLRMKMAGKLNTKAETYDSLLEKHSVITEKIKNLELTITLQKSEQKESNESEVDALDAFMSKLDTSVLSKTTLRSMKMDLLNLRKEETQILKLINIAKPANLPPLKPYIAPEDDKKNDGTKKPQPMIGKRKEMKIALKKNPVPEIAETSKMDVDEDDELSDGAATAKTPTRSPAPKLDSKTESNERLTNVPDIIEKTENQINPESIDIEEEQKDVQNQEQSESTTEKSKKNKRKRHKQTEKKMPEFKPDSGYDENYSTWVFPEDQSGDGRTKLNDKYGY